MIGRASNVFSFPGVPAEDTSTPAQKEWGDYNHRATHDRSSITPEEWERHRRTGWYTTTDVATGNPFWYRPPPKPDKKSKKSKEPKPPAAPVAATPYVPRDPSTIPPRKWVYGRQLLRGSLSLLIAPGAAGKTSLLASTALALASGNALLGYEVHGGPKRVWLWNLEDSLTELARLVEAARLHYDLDADALGDRLFVDSGLEGSPLMLAKQRERGPAEVAERTFAAISAELQAREIDVLILDPFVSSHLASENDNGAIDAIAKRLSRLAVEADCAIFVAHHTSKLGGADATAEKARGASALVNAARSAVVLNKLTATDAPKIGVSPDQHGRYFRVMDEKNNRAPPAAASDWFRLVSVELGNGDNLPVVERYFPPEIELPETDASEIAAALGTEAWRDNKQSPEWAGYRLAERLRWDAGAAGASRTADQLAHLKAVEGLIAQALREGWVERVQLPDEKRKPRGFLRVAAPPCSTQGGAPVANSAPPPPFCR